MLCAIRKSGWRGGLMIRHSASVLIVLAWFIVGASQARAQDVPPPNSDTFILYYEDENPNLLDFWLLRENICLEAIIRLNPGLDYNRISYGTPLLAPRNEPCYDYDRSQYGWWNFGDGYPPRLKYFEDGQWLAEPYYSDEVVYQRPDSLDELAQAYDLCLHDLLNHNYLLHDFDSYWLYFRHSMDVFIPKQRSDCRYRASFIVQQMTQAEIVPTYFPSQHNICVEEVDLARWRETFYLPRTSPDVVEVFIPVDAPPCYVKGQRLAYYDHTTGRRLESPIYSPYPVYVAPPRTSIQQIAHETGVCLIDLLRINGFPDMPLAVEIELFIPPVRPCPENVVSRTVKSADLRTIALTTGICPEVLLDLNPHFEDRRDGWHLGKHIFFSTTIPHWIIIPRDIQPCFLTVSDAQSLADAERQYNICREAFFTETHWYVIVSRQYPLPTIYARRDSAPCYNDDGRRLYFANEPLYHDPIMGIPVPDYAPLHYHRFRKRDFVYSISKLYNVCVEELLRINPTLRSSRPIRQEIFVPQTRLCYDQATGLPLVYEDESGAPLATPRVGHHLMYYGSQGLGRIAYYYNVCINRIEDANRDKLERRASYLGWIIPTDRPPCYDAQGEQIYYVCYDQPVDLAVDYRGISPPLTFNPDGTHCYDLAARDTLVWYDGQAYQVINYWNTMLSSRAFTAWCYGVSQEGIDAINEVPEVLALLPLHHRAIPQATRACYVHDANALGGAKIIHTVFPDETLIGIAARYDKLPSWIAEANDLDLDQTIWVGQKLIVPENGSVRAIFERMAGFTGLIALSALGWLRRRRR
jgi:LysM repeat protein